jgi:diamine N-acetyltransferase
MPTDPTRVRLEPLTLAHLPHVMTWVNDDEVMQYFANRQTDISEEEERRYLEWLIHSPNDRAYSIFDAGDGRYLGQCSVNAIYHPAKNGRLFLVIKRDEQHQGYGGAALEALVGRCFGELELHKLWLIVRRDNHAAQAMYAKLGFDFEGVLRDEYFVKGRFHDMVRMARLRPAQIPLGL